MVDRKVTTIPVYLMILIPPCVFINFTTFTFDALIPTSDLAYTLYRIASHCATCGQYFCKSCGGLVGIQNKTMPQALVKAAIG